MVKADEPAKGLISSVAGLAGPGRHRYPGVGRRTADALATQVGVSAGPLKASASGTVDLQHQAADLALRAEAPAMTPAAGISWNSVLIDAKVHGPFKTPDANGTVDIQALAAAGARIGELNAAIAGNAGHVQLHASVKQLLVPGPRPDLLAAAPVLLDVSAQLNAPDRPVTFSLHHPLVAVDGSATTEARRQVQAHLALPALAPLAAVGGVDLQGSTDLDLQAAMDGDTTMIAAKGDVAITGGMAPVPALIGPKGSIDIAASLHGQDVTLSRLEVNGKALEVSAEGDVTQRSGSTDQTVRLDWAVKLADLTAIQPDLSGSVAATGQASGKTGCAGCHDGR